MSIKKAVIRYNEVFKFLTNRFLSRYTRFSRERSMKKSSKIIEWRKNARRWRESHDPCGQLWRNYRHPVYKERKFVSGSIGAKLAWTLKVISLSGLREDDGSDENLGPLINAGGLCTVHTKPSNKRSPVLYWPRTKLARDSLEGEKAAA